MLLTKLPKDILVYILHMLDWPTCFQLAHVWPDGSLMNIIRQYRPPSLPDLPKRAIICILKMLDWASCRRLNHVWPCWSLINTHRPTSLLDLPVRALKLIMWHLGRHSNRLGLKSYINCTGIHGNNVNYYFFP
jgi:hypothetical protein